MNKSLGSLALSLFLSAALLAQAGPIATPQWRPVYHFTPESNWTNDPNGLLYLNGEYHLYNQQNPFDNKWGHMSWGHATSTDLIHWRHLPIAIPEIVDKKDTTWIFSGCSVWDKNNTSGFCKTGGCMVVVYTADQPNQKKESQYVAYSNDGGMTFTNYEHNPVIDLHKKDFRDPNVTWNEELKKWLMVVVVPYEYKAQFYVSDNLKKWELLSEFGPAGYTGAPWECPSLIQLPIEGSPQKKKWALLVSAAGGKKGVFMQYFTGTFAKGTFTNDNPPNKILTVDYGDCFYAAIPWNRVPADKKILLGWMMQGKASTHPWTGQMSIPRDLSLRQTTEGLRLTQQPTSVITNNRSILAGQPAVDKKDLSIDNKEITLQPTTGNAYWIKAEWIVPPGTKAGFKIAGKAEIGYDPSSHQLFIKNPDSEPATINLAGTLRSLHLEILLDKSSLEIFVNNGEKVFTTHVYPAAGNSRLSAFSTAGRSTLKSLKVWDLGDPTHRAPGQPTVTVVHRPPTTSTNTSYIGNRSPLLPLYFIKLPVGSIQPGGWVRKYLELQRDGLTGQLGHISAWLDKNNNAWFSGTGKGDHGWEEVPYWLKGYGDLGYILKDETIIAETKAWLEKVFQSQTPDGYFGPRVIENQHQDNKGGTPDLWPNMLMLWCMQSWYEYSHDPRVIPFMTKYFRWQTTVPDDQLLKIYWENSRGGDNLYSIYWLYNITGGKWLLDLAKKIHRNTANWAQKDRLPNWHNVNIAQCFREPATYYMQAQDSSLLKATYNDFYLVRNLYGQVPGGMFGADENARKGFDDPRQAIETCGMVEQMASDEILTGITGDPMWADNCEDVAFNTYPAAVMPDFKGLRYLTAPNMVVSDSRNHAPGIQNDGPFLMMNPFSSRCCQHNHAQGWPYYAEHLWMATPDNGIAAILYSSSEVAAKLGSGKKTSLVTLKQSTNYPFDDQVKIELSASTPINFPLYLRIPAWCDHAALKINGLTTPLPQAAIGSDPSAPGSYIRIERNWRPGDIVELTLPMHFTIREWQKNHNSVSLNYGPLSFSVKIEESYKRMDGRSAAQGDSKWQANADQAKWPSYEIYPASLWNYGLALTIQPLTDQFELIKRPWPADNFPFTPDTVPFIVKAKGKIIPEWILDKYGLCGLLPQSPVSTTTHEQTIELIPMGAARLRISAIPVVK